MFFVTIYLIFKFTAAPPLRFLGVTLYKVRFNEFNLLVSKQTGFRYSHVSVEPANYTAILDRSLLVTHFNFVV